MCIKITVDEIPPSNNEFMGNSRNFNIYRQKKEYWEWLMHAGIKRTNKPDKPFEKAVVNIRYFFKDRRRRDPDNYSGKMILDPLVREGIIKDDSFDVISLILSAAVDGERPRTEIEVMNISDE